MPEYFKPHYDVIVIGAALAGCSAAITLAKRGLDVLVLEQHNLPGGVATSYIRHGVEFEASLHELSNVGSEACPLWTRNFFKEHEIDIDFVRIDDAIHYVSPNVDIVIHAGSAGDFSVPCRDICNAVGDKDGKLYKKLMRFFKVCENVRVGADAASVTPMPSKAHLLTHHFDFVSTMPYSAKEVIDTYKFPPLVNEILGVYWVYMGSPLDELPFSLYSYILADYLGHGAYIPRHTSYEMSAKLAAKARVLGVQIEYGQRVDKILAHDGMVNGVRLSNGIELTCDYVVSGAYPNTVYSKMIEPKEEVPRKALQFVHSLDLSVSCFSVVLLLDRKAADLGIHQYATFYAAREGDSRFFFDQLNEDGPWEYLTSVCPNLATPEASPKGTCVYSITALPRENATRGISLENYGDFKQRHVRDFLDLESKRLGANLRDHILSISVETPFTISRYTGAYHGAIYGYRHAIKGHPMARAQLPEDERFIRHLYFAGAHQFTGDGMSPALINGQTAAKQLLREKEKNV